MPGRLRVSCSLMRHSGTVTTDAVILRDAVAGYAARLHAAPGPGHHVASPLGAWLLLALCAPATRNGAPPDPALAEVLGGEVPYGDVLAAAQRLGSAAVTGAPVTRRALADLPLGETPRWRIAEEPAGTGGTGDRFTAVLPAWSARSELDLGGPELGFAAAAAALAGTDPWTAVQSALARYTRTGFEAAAVSAVTIMASARRPLAGRRRVAELRFGQPYAVAAVAVDPGADGQPGLWHGVPVFSAWVADPQDAADEPEQRGVPQ